MKTEDKELLVILAVITGAGLGLFGLAVLFRELILFVYTAL